MSPYGQRVGVIYLCDRDSVIYICVPTAWDRAWHQVLIEGTRHSAGNVLTAGTKLRNRKALRFYLVQPPHYTSEEIEAQGAKTNCLRSLT